MSLEDAGFCRKGEIGAFYDSVDTTYQGSFPVNTDGGQISAGQPVGGAGGVRHVIEAARQLMGRAGARQIANHDLCPSVLLSQVGVPAVSVQSPH